MVSQEHAKPFGSMLREAKVLSVYCTMNNTWLLTLATSLRKNNFSPTEYREAQDEFGDDFEAKMGAEAVRDVLGRIDLEDELEELMTKCMKPSLSKLRKSWPVDLR